MNKVVNVTSKLSKSAGLLYNLISVHDNTVICSTITTYITNTKIKWIAKYNLDDLQNKVYPSWIDINKTPFYSLLTIYYNHKECFVLILFVKMKTLCLRYRAPTSSSLLCKFNFTSFFRLMIIRATQYKSLVLRALNLTYYGEIICEKTWIAGRCPWIFLIENFEEKHFLLEKKCQSIWSGRLATIS